MDPGYFPAALDTEVNYYNDIFAPPTHDYEVGDITIATKWCTTCRFYRLPRSTHCSTCDKCVELTKKFPTKTNPFFDSCGKQWLHLFCSPNFPTHVDPNSKKQAVKLEKMHAKLIKRWVEEKRLKDQIALTAVNGNRFTRGTVVGASGRPLLSDEHSIDNIPEAKIVTYSPLRTKTTPIKPVLYPSVKENKTINGPSLPQSGDARIMTASTWSNEDAASLGTLDRLVALRQSIDDGSSVGTPNTGGTTALTSGGGSLGVRSGTRAQSSGIGATRTEGSSVISGISAGTNTTVATTAQLAAARSSLQPFPNRESESYCNLFVNGSVEGVSSSIARGSGDADSGCYQNGGGSDAGGSTLPPLVTSLPRPPSSSNSNNNNNFVQLRSPSPNLISFSPTQQHIPVRPYDIDTPGTPLDTMGNNGNEEDSRRFSAFFAPRAVAPCASIESLGTTSSFSVSASNTSLHNRSGGDEKQLPRASTTNNSNQKSPSSSII
nr:hypothetical transcript [Hymenolepis microstoma]